MNFGFTYHGNVDELKKYQSTNDIVKYMLQYHKKYRPEYDKAALEFWKGSVPATGKFLFDFLKKNISYDVEPNEDQTIKSPGALMHDGHGDCKHYASFICGIVDSLKRQGYPIACKYRFASYGANSTPHHTFAVIVDPATGKEYWTDPVLPSFNNRKQYNHSFDKSPGMLSSISGIDDGIGRKSKAERAKRKEGKKAKRKERKANRPKGGFLKKIGGAPARNAYLLLLKMNLFRTASKIMDKVKDDPEKQRALKAKWAKLGGNWSFLKKNIEQGVRVWNKHHKNKQIQGKLSGVPNKYGWDAVYKGIFMPGIGEVPFECQRVGIVPVVAGAAAVVAAAAPIIKAMKGLLSSLGVKPDTAAEEEATAEGDQVLEDAATNSNASAEDDTYTGEDMSDPAPPDNDAFLDPNTVSSEGDEVPGDDDYNIVNGFGLLRSKKGKARVAARKAAKPGSKATPVKMKPVTVRAKRVSTANVKLPIARKTKTVTRAPFLQITTSKVPNQPLANKQYLHVPRVEATPQRQTTDGGGVSNFFDEVKNFASQNKTPLLLAGAGLLAYKFLLNQPKRRR